MPRTKSYKKLCIFLLASIMIVLLNNCKNDNNISKDDDATAEKKMLDILETTRLKLNTHNDFFASAKKLEYIDSLIPITKDATEQLNLGFKRAQTLLENGDEKAAVELLEKIVDFVKTVPQSRAVALPALGMAYLRLAERKNCILNHSNESCIMPIEGMGIHQDKEPSKKAIECFKTALSEHPDDYDSRWLINIAYMTIGAYPNEVPKQWLILGLDSQGKIKVNQFKDIAEDLGIGKSSMAGGLIIDDFDNDGNLDIIYSSWGLSDPLHFYRNTGDGNFVDVSEKSHISRFKGGLNMVQTDYNNDGNLDFFILRGGWQGYEGAVHQANSLIRNNGDGTFTDVTLKAGIFSEHPTQTASWNDFNNDGWLDLFIGNESTSATAQHPCELFINNKNGTFTNVAEKIGLDIKVFAKAVATGDYDNDGWIDVFVSTMGNQKVLLHNKGKSGNGFGFDMVSDKAGFPKEFKEGTFPSWFFDYDNDGWLDLLMVNYNFDRPLSYYSAKEALHPSDDPTGKIHIFHNNQNGTFSDVSKTMDINQTVFAMGSNFGDIDNDGYLDMYFGTGNPAYQSVIPNRLYKNINGKNFAEVTNSARVGHIQKGHGVSFGDLNNDGWQDISIKMGGAFNGDGYQSSIFLNPGQNTTNHFLGLKLEGTKSNKPGIGSKVTVKIHEGNKERIIYREVNSGGSFGCSPLRQEIGIGTATIIDELKIVWPASGITQVFKNIKPDQFIKVNEGKQAYEILSVNKIQFKDLQNKVIMCAPVK